MNLSSSEILFLQVLRSSLWEVGKFDIEGEYSKKDFVKILSIAHDQAVLGIVGDSLINRISSGCPLPTSIGVETGFLVLKIQQRNKLINSTIEKVVSNFKANNIETTLLKGQGMASLYPTPLLRQGGDIDLYVNESIFAKAVAVIKTITGEHEDDHYTLKHFGCKCGEIEIELHRYSDYLSFRKKKNRYFQKISLEGLCNTNRTLQFNNIDVQLPTGHYDCVFILQHLWNHLITGGVGFRQVCDWMLTVNRFNNELDTIKLEKDLKACGINNAWKYLSYICVNYLGLEKTTCPLYDDSIEVKETSEKLLRVIFDDGNFGKKNSDKNEQGRPENYIGSKIHSLKNNFTRLKKTVGYVEKEDRIAYYLEYLRSTTERL